MLFYFCIVVHNETRHIVDPAFRLMRFHSMVSSIFILKNGFIYLENDLDSPLIFVLFLKGKQNKKENLKCNSLFWKKVVCKKLDQGSRVRLLIG